MPRGAGGKDSEWHQWIWSLDRESIMERECCSIIIIIFKWESAPPQHTHHGTV